MAKHNAAPVIIKKVKATAHAGHHGGAWKVAYADFVTAMMSFFLLLWLLNVTTDVQKRGIADYFEPTISSKSQSGAGGVLGGLTIGSPGSQSIPLSQPALQMARMALRQPEEGDDGNDGGTAGTDPKQQEQNAGSQSDVKPIDDTDLEKRFAEREQRRFQAAENALREAIKDTPELAKLADNLIIQNTPEGLRIQLVDQDRQPMFPLGSAEMLEPAKKLMALVAQAVQRLPNKIAITGHTDSASYPMGGKYSNWELSTDRANASRREFIADGVPAGRVSRIAGLADREPFVPDNPASAENRRISIVLLREAKELPSDLAGK
ncbi:MAG TPA: flagellar motor protein MotB [Stellaceae bacterium]|nr:flagellar motor protein MotB [Stellaceae bacterium]